MKLKSGVKAGSVCNKDEDYKVGLKGNYCRNAYTGKMRKV